MNILGWVIVIRVAGGVELPDPPRAYESLFSCDRHAAELGSAFYCARGSLQYDKNGIVIFVPIEK